MSSIIETIEYLRSLFFEEEFSWESFEDETAYNEIERGNIPNVQFLTLILKTPVKSKLLVFSCRLLIATTEYQLNLSWKDNSWLSRQDFECLSGQLTTQQGIVEDIQQIQNAAESILIETTVQTVSKKLSYEFLREWIWFPMIYTREKRGHILSWASSYQITGFLCPGKPGCMCLEGSKEKVAEFIHDIKTVSWSDLPSSHKKMTSQWKEAFVCKDLEDFESRRLFKNMIEVKFDIHGTFSNHNDLGKLQDWMVNKGCGEAFEHLFQMS
ncbi:hypothetical protein BY458DRAFT_497763 [Sporodiniella umbellata]|nr:hypothetical protein BY458DRAFT_497763 [Sporodiniella umbellata]